MRVSASILSLVEFTNKNRQPVLNKQPREQETSRSWVQEAALLLTSSLTDCLFHHMLLARRAVREFIKQFWILWNKGTQFVTSFWQFLCSSIDTISYSKRILSICAESYLDLKFNWERDPPRWLSLTSNAPVATCLHRNPKALQVYLLQEEVVEKSIFFSLWWGHEKQAIPRKCSRCFCVSPASSQGQAEQRGDWQAAVETCC